MKSCPWELNNAEGDSLQQDLLQLPNTSNPLRAVSPPVRHKDQRTAERSYVKCGFVLSSRLGS